MDSASLVRGVTARAALGSEDKGTEVVEATLATVAGSVGPGAAARLAAALPEELARLLEAGGGDPGEASTDELVAKVAARTGIASSAAPGYVAAVFAALREEAGPEVVEDLLDALPEDFRIMLEGEPAWTDSGG